MQETETTNKNASHKTRRRLLRTAIVLAGLGVLAGIGSVAGVIGAYYYVAPGLPQAETIRDIPLQIPLRIYSRDGALMREIGDRKRILVSFDEVPDHVVQAFVAAEDQRFWVHPGIDYRGVLRAFARLISTGSAAGGGGSTLTQQLARSYFLNLDRTVDRKFKEAALSVRIEDEFSKEQIMELFLNKMFFGQRAYGVAAAAQVFFGKDLADLNVAEAATLAGVLPAPSRYNPVRSAVNAGNRRTYVLGRMRTLGYIDDAAYEEAMDFPMESELHGADLDLRADYVAEMVRREMLDRYGEDTYNAGYQVVTSIDSRLQEAATYSLRNGLLEFTRRRGYREPIARIASTPELLDVPFAEWPEEIHSALDRYAPGGLSVALVTAVHENSASIVLRDGSSDAIPWSGLKWANKFIDRETFGPAPETAAEVVAVGDLIYVMPTATGFWALAQKPDAQAAVVSVDPIDGAITSLAGGFDFATSKYNRVTQASRQPGSSFKPFIYSAALENGNTAATVVDDSPVVIRSSELEKDWRPINYTGRFYGPTRLREALTRSMNLVSVRLLLYETGVGNAVEHIAKFGFGDAALPRNGSLALGGGNATPLDMAQGYAILANGGYFVSPYVIDAIYGPEGETLYRAEPKVVCRECETDSDVEGRPTTQRSGMSLEAMADIADSYRPTAEDAPETFALINAAPRVISEQNAYLIQDMMRNVITSGTGRRAMQLGRTDLSGKTGTSNDRRDAWFGGFNGDLASIVWVGYDESAPLGPGEEGGRTALPIWVEFARIAYEGVPNHRMPMPPGMVSVKINREDGCPAGSGQTNTIFEIFREDHVPDCESLQDVPEIFNDTSGIDDMLMHPDADEEPPAEEDAEESDEELF